MTEADRINWLINLEDLSNQVDAATVKFVCELFGARNIYNLRSCDLNNAYNELFQYAVNAND